MTFTKNVPRSAKGSVVDLSLVQFPSRYLSESFNDLSTQQWVLDDEIWQPSDAGMVDM